MRKIIAIIIGVVVLSFNMYAQVVINSKFRPLTYEQLEVQAQVNWLREQYNKQQFEEYKEEAYERLRNLDYNGFIYYSDYALSFGWYNAKMYYDRGQVFEILNEYRKAKKEYKKAIKAGYYPAVQALKQCQEKYKKRKNNW